nr:hypothetical protein [Tanacetum cinerariifolium]
SEDVNEGKHSRMSSSKERGNVEDMIQELADEYMDHLELGKSKDDIGNVEIGVSSEKRNLIVSEDVNDVSVKRQKMCESDRWNGDEDKCEIVDIIDDVVVVDDK